MQPDLFSEQTSPTETPQAGFGTVARQAFRREQKYQESKRESQKLQRQWRAGKDRRETEMEERKNTSIALNNAAPITLVLVSCVSQKLKTASKAKDLYISDWFLKARAYAELIGDKWMILSARYELLDTEAVIEPFEQTLNGQRKGDREAWANRVASRIRSQIPPESKIVILAGAMYRECLVPMLKDQYLMEAPLEGLGIGEQKSFLKKAAQL